MNRIMQYIKQLWNRKIQYIKQLWNSFMQYIKKKSNIKQLTHHVFWVICVFGIPTLLVVVFIHSCKANDYLTDTLNKHQEVLSTLQNSVLENTAGNLGQRYKDSLIQITRQTLSSHEFNNDSTWKKSSKGDIIVPVTLNVQLEELSQTMKETPEKIQACGKWFFDSNTVTFLVSLIVALLIAIIINIQSKMEKSLRKNQKTFDKYKNQIKIIKEENQQTFDNYNDQITNDSKSMDLYVRIYALHNTSITIRQFLTLYLSKQSNIELLPELVYQATNSIDDIKYLLKDKFIVKKDIFNMMYKTLSSTYQNLEHKKLKEVPEYEDIKALLTDVTGDIKNLIQKIEEYKEKDNQNTAA